LYTNSWSDTKQMGNAFNNLCIQIAGQILNRWVMPSITFVTNS
jgi:hypothetical protein